ncbi:MAG: hypothetical protein ABI688_03710 [Bacteroidota bacterium]
MNNFRKLYLFTCVLLLFSQLLTLFILAYCKKVLGKVLYYGDPEEQNPGHEKYFTALEILLYSTFILVILWCILTPFAVIANRRSYEEAKINIYIGATGFVLAIILLLTDPFGIFKLFTS